LQLTVAVSAAAVPEVINRARAWTAGEKRERDNHATDVTAVVNPRLLPWRQRVGPDGSEPSLVA